MCVETLPCLIIYFFFLCQTGVSGCSVANSFFIFLTQLTFTLNAFFQNVSLRIVCMECLILNSYHHTFCFHPLCLQTSAISRTGLWPPIFCLNYMEIVHAPFLFQFLHYILNYTIFYLLCLLWKAFLKLLFKIVLNLYYVGESSQSVSVDILYFSHINFVTFTCFFYLHQASSFLFSGNI
jgi:hypothetical protein